MRFRRYHWIAVAFLVIAVASFIMRAAHWGFLK